MFDILSNAQEFFERHQIYPNLLLAFQIERLKGDLDIKFIERRDMIKFWSGKKKTDGDAVVIKIDCACGQLTYIPPKEIQAILRDNPMAREAMEGTFHALTIH